MNPLNTQGEIFDLGLMNPSPSSKKTKNGPKYYCKFEIDEEFHSALMAANTTGMIIACKAMVTQDGQFIEPESPPEPKKEKGPYGDFANYLHKSGFFNAPELRSHLGVAQNDDLSHVLSVFKLSIGIDSLTDLSPTMLMHYLYGRNLFKSTMLIEQYTRKGD